MVDWKSPEWQRIRKTADWNQRMELGFLRGMVAFLVPVFAYFYSPRLAVVLAIPFGYAFYWYMARAVRRFAKRAP